MLQVGIPHVAVHLDALVIEHAPDLTEGILAPRLAINDVELAARTAHFGVHVIALASCRQSTPDVIEPRQSELGRKRVAYIALAQRFFV